MITTVKSRNGNTLTQIVALSVGGLDAHLIPQNVQPLEQNKEIRPGSRGGMVVVRHTVSPLKYS